MTDQTNDQQPPAPQPPAEPTTRERGTGISVEWMPDYPTQGTYSDR